MTASDLATDSCHGCVFDSRTGAAPDGSTRQRLAATRVVDRDSSLARSLPSANAWAPSASPGSARVSGGTRIERFGSYGRRLPHPHGDTG
jgi:hypothetical protein